DRARSPGAGGARGGGGPPPGRFRESPAPSRAFPRRGGRVLLHKPMTTSARRFLEGGVWRVLAHDAWVWGRDLLGLPTEGFGPAYREDNVRRGAPVAPLPRAPAPL